MTGDGEGGEVTQGFSNYIQYMYFFLWLCGVVVDAWTRDLMVPGSNPPSAAQSVFLGKGYLHTFPHPTHV